MFLLTPLLLVLVKHSWRGPIGALSEGKEPSLNVFALGEPDVELKKRLISSLLGGSDIFIYDNVMGTFNSPTLASNT